jgi:hypothetical protein
MLNLTRAVESLATEGNTQPCWQHCPAAAEEAQQLLCSAWFKPDFAARVSALCQRHSQPVPQAGHGVDGVLQDMRACSLGLGRDFEAVWFDTQQQRWCLMPNAFVRSKFLLQAA